MLCLRPLIDTIQTVVFLVDLPDEISWRVSTLCLILRLSPLAALYSRTSHSYHVLSRIQTCLPFIMIVQLFLRQRPQFSLSVPLRQCLLDALFHTVLDAVL